MFLFMGHVAARTAEVYEDERKFHYQAVGPKFEETGRRWDWTDHGHTELRHGALNVASLLLVAMPFAPSSVLAPSSTARSP